jgi:hypothetical protein
MPKDGSIGLVNHCNPHCRQAIANLICHSKVTLLSGRLALLNQVSNGQYRPVAIAPSTNPTAIVSTPL